MRKLWVKVLVGLVLLGVAALGWMWFQYQGFQQSMLAVEEEGQSFVVASGESLATVAAKLEEEGVIGDARCFRWMARLSGNAHRIKAGEYLLQPSMTNRQLLQQMVEGKVREYAITLIEGRNFREMMAVINANPYLGHSLKGLSGSEVMETIGYPEGHPEGRFLPETYHFPRGMSDVKLLQRAYQALAERLQYAHLAARMGHVAAESGRGTAV